MNKVQRDDALERIRTKSKYKVILISFKAGSTGLNLTCCNNVILVDLWWNPALEDQAFDRAHRLGQTRDVNIHKLSVPETVEQRILEVSSLCSRHGDVTDNSAVTATREEKGTRGRRLSG